MNAGRRPAARTGLDREASRERSVAARASTGLLCTRRSLEVVGREMLAFAERLAELLNAEGSSDLSA
jgi:hypothetical protein